MTHTLTEIAGSDVETARQFHVDVAEQCRPVVLRGLVKHWPVVQSGLQSPQSLQSYLQKFDSGLQAEAFFGEPRIAGKYYYSDDMKGFNFERRRMKLADAVATMVATINRPDTH